MNNSNNELKKSLEDRAKKIYDRIIQSKISKLEQIKGCNEQEIEKLEQTYNITLPYSYKACLKYFGHGFVSIGNEFEYLYKDALLITQDERNLEQDMKQEADFNPEDLLPENSFVFARRQDIQIWYFVATEGIEDPPVFYQDTGDVEKMYESIFDFWEMLVTYAEQILVRQKEK